MTSQRSGAPTPSTSRHVRSLGLSKLRQRKGVSLEDIAEKTKISIRFLRAIEDEEFEKLPGGIFNTSYIRQYAQAIDHEESELLEYYNLRMGVEYAATSKNDGTSNQAKVKGLRFPAALVGL